MILQGDFEKHQGIRYEFDRFQKPIGEGGMGVVFKGAMYDDNTGVFLREVAIKEVAPQVTPEETETLVKKAKREASIRLHNDNLVEMLSFIEVDDNKLRIVKKKYYVVSEFLSGVTLSDILQGNYKDYAGNIIEYARQIGENLKSEPTKTASHIIKSILYGITALHDNGYIHRDVDPSNIMITEDGYIKLIDFGIAKRLDELDAQDEMLCNGLFMGKVEYASPELINGDINNQGFYTDIYGIGALFYRLITGRLPFEGNRIEMLNAHCKKPLNGSLITDKKCRSIICKAMSKKREDRYQTSSEMRVALDKSAPEPDPSPDIFKVIKIVVALALVLLAVLVVKEMIDNYKEKINNYKEISPIEQPDPVNPNKQKQPAAKIDYSSYDKARLLKEFLSKPTDANLLYAIAMKYKGSQVDSSAREKIWEGYLVPNKYPERNISDPDKWNFATERFVFLTFAMAMDNANANEQGLKDSIRYQLDILENKYEFYKYVPLNH